MGLPKALSVPYDRDVKSIRAALVLIFAFSGAFFAFGTSASSQGTEPYVSPFGDLTIEADSLLPGATVRLSGDGFTPETPVFLTVRENASATVLVEDEGEADVAGAVAFELVLSEGFGPGGYSASVRGTTIDGAILDLSGAFNIDAPPEPTPTPEQAPARPDPTPTPEPTPRPAATPLPTPRPPITGPTPTPDGAVPTPSATAVPATPGPEDAEVLGETVDDNDPIAGASGDADETGGASTSGTSEDPDSDGDDGDAAGDPASSGSDDDPSDVDEIAAPAIEGSGGVGGGQVAGIVAAIAAIGGAAFYLYRRSTRIKPTHAE